MRFVHVWVLFLLMSTPASLVAQETRWFRGNLHTHSLWSDGNDFPEMICDWYREHGYHFVALSDHNVLSDSEKWIKESVLTKREATEALERYRQRFGAEWVETRMRDDQTEVRLKMLKEYRGKLEKPGEFLLVQGEEITDSFESIPIHMCASDLEELIRPRGGESLRDVIRNNLLAVAEQSARIGRPILAHLNHPNYGYAVTAEDLAAVTQERFFEIYNGHPGVNQQGDAKHASMEQMWDIANTLRIAELKSPPLFGLGTDDSHHYLGSRGATPGRGWVMVRATELNATRLINAMNRGDFYASSGVELSEMICDEQEGRIEVKIVPRPGATYVTEFIGTKRAYDTSSDPVLDDQGNPMRVTRKYPADVGRVLAKVEGSHATYRLNGEELYVRARITSSEAPENPSYAEQRRQAWTQPIGWRKWLEAAPKPEAKPEPSPR